MARGRIIQTNFSGGELSPRMYGRTDLAQYAQGAAELTNFLVQSQGGITRRSGSIYIGNNKSATSRVRMVPFVVSSLTAYVLEFGHLYIRFWRNRAQLVGPGAIPLELATPYVLADLRALRIAQSADVAYITHASYQPQKLSRTTATTFTLTPFSPINGPYDGENTGDVPGAASAAVATAAEVATTTPAVTGSAVDIVTSSGSGPDGGGGGGDAGGGEGGGGESA